MKLIAVTIALACFQTVICDTPNSADRFVGAKNPQIGFRDDCHLFWKSDDSYRKNAEFRCGTSKGDPIWIKKRGDKYAIGSSNCPLVWNGDEGNRKNAEFRRGRPISDHLFDIIRRPNGLWAIVSTSNCPLYWSASSDSTKNAEFRCGSPISDLFWIKGAGCNLTTVKILESDDNVKYDGDELIGVNTAGSCSGGQHSLQLQQSHQLTEQLTLGTSESTERNWEISTSVSVEASAKFLGSGVSVTARRDASSGSSTSWGSSREKSTGTSSSTSSGVRINYKTPGAALVIGFARRYTFDNSKVPAKVTVTCKKNYSFTYETYFR